MKVREVLLARIPEYRPPAEPGTGGWVAAWRCRRKGGHFDGRGYVNHGRSVSWSRVCSKCNRYLGPAPINDPWLAGTRPPTDFED